ncbi:MAG TPA: hypothetical protein VF781_12780 [Solirubrobacteraceae bacterium]
MRVLKCLPTLAAAVTVFATGSVPAYAFDNQAPNAASLPAAPVAVSHPAESSDLALELGAGGIVVAGGVLATRQLRRRPSRTIHNPRTASGS